MISWETPTGRIRVARDTAPMSPELERAAEKARLRAKGRAAGLKRRMTEVGGR